MSPRTRVLAVVAAVAVLAVAATVGATWAQSRGQSTQAAGSVTRPRAGHPPLALDFGVRSDPEAVALSHAEQLLAKKGRERQALAIFERYHSVDAQIGALFAEWPAGGGLDAMKRIVAEHPRNATAQFHLAWALLWTGRAADAVAQFRRVDSQFPDSPEAVLAEDVLYPKMAPNLPTLVLGLSLPSAPTAAQQLRTVEQAARAGGVDAKLRYGLALWDLHRRVSAERQFAAAAALAPRSPVAQTAAAVGRFTKRDPVAAFSRLGPLSGVFPRASVVRLHLGTLLLWTGQIRKAAKEFRLAERAEPDTPFARAAREFLSIIPANGSK